MSKYVNAADAAEKIAEKHGIPLGDLVDTFAEIPAADVVEVRHGRWTIAEDDYCGLNIVKCSVCHEEWCFEEGDDVFDLNYHYCPNCGAKMDKEVADDKKQPEEAPGE